MLKVKNRKVQKLKLCLVCSSGGHLLPLHLLKDFWQEFDRVWVTFDTKDSRSLLVNENVIYAFSPTNRNILNLLKNTFLAIKLLRAEKPHVIVSTGAGVCVPFIYIGKLLKIKTIYLELMTRVDSLSLSAKLIYPVVDHLLVQWPELAEKYKKARFEGRYV
jgi:beta-1,4-N-acetylglucosaminyltransferase